MAIHTTLQIYGAAYDLLGVAVDAVKNMPRDVKPVMGSRIAAAAPEDLFTKANSYFGMLRQATASHRDRALLANLVRRRGLAVNRALTKALA